MTQSAEAAPPPLPVSRCQCVATHNPHPRNEAIHHILPKSWGGPDVAENTVILCPTTHENVHTLLNQYVHHGGEPPANVMAMFNHYTRGLAAKGWEQRPNDHPPYTTQYGLLEDHTH